MLLRIATLTYLVCYIISCNSAQFKSKDRAKRKDQPVNLSCSIIPNELKLNQRGQIAITTGEDYRGNVFQVIKGQGKEQRAKLVFAADKGFALESGNANEMAFDQPGDYTIELRLDENSPEVKGQCQFKVTGDKVCDPLESAVGTDVLFVIDNSGSNAATDCKDPRTIGASSGIPLVNCQAPTNRERAVQTAFGVLSEFAERQANNQNAISNIGIVSFPTEDRLDDGYLKHGIWPSAKQNGEQINQAMAFTRKPRGRTPYGAGLLGANELAGSFQQNNNRKKVAVFVTDGEPTSKDPDEEVKQADSLFNRGYEIVTIFVNNGQDRQSRIQQHINMLQGFDRNSNGGWFNRSKYADFQTYINHLLGSEKDLSLIQKITSKKDSNCKDEPAGKVCERKLIEVQQSEALEKVFRDIVNQSVQCK